MPKRNYGYEKRQKELNKQRKRDEKRDEKRQRKLARAGDPVDGPGPDQPASPDLPPTPTGS